MQLVDTVACSICVGKPLGDATVWATAASLLAVFDFGKTRDEKGNIIEVDGKYSDGMIRCGTFYSEINLSIQNISAILCHSNVRLHLGRKVLEN